MEILREAPTPSRGWPYGYGIGLRIKQSSDIHISDSEFRIWWAATLSGQSARLAFVENDIHTIRSDGINVDAVTDWSSKKITFAISVALQDRKTIAI